MKENTLKEKLKQKCIKLAKKLIFTFKNETSFTRRYKFEDRSKNSDTLCMILSGYKEFTWDIIFERIKKFADDDMDICIVSSGLYSQRLSEIAKENNWSYISTKRNCIPLIQNMALKLFPNAKYIYKLDEDIFVTKNFFKTVRETYDEVQENGEYNVGFVAPILPLNGYAHVRLLKKLDLMDYYEEHFEKVKYAAGSQRFIESNEDVAKFMWGRNDIIPHIDDLDQILHDMPFEYSASTVRFSIGAIFYHRDLWEEMPYFKVDFTKGLGMDEVQLCAFCINSSKGMIISENTAVGHLSFGPQNHEMEKFFIENQNRFLIKEN